MDVDPPRGQGRPQAGVPVDTDPEGAMEENELEPDGAVPVPTSTESSSFSALKISLGRRSEYEMQYSFYRVMKVFHSLLVQVPYQISSQ